MRAQEGGTRLLPNGAPGWCAPNLLSILWIWWTRGPGNTVRAAACSSIQRWSGLWHNGIISNWFTRICLSWWHQELWTVFECCDVLSMFVMSKWQCVVLLTCWRASVRALSYCYHTFLDHTTNISRKVHTLRRISVSERQTMFKNVPWTKQTWTKHHNTYLDTHKVGR